GTGLSADATPRRSGFRVFAGHALHEINDPAPKLRILDLHERPVELQTFRARQEIHDVAGLPRLVHAGLPVRRTSGGVLEEERHRDLQDAGNMLQTAGADAVRALLVLLDLLECDSQMLPKLFLAHGQ